MDRNVALRDQPFFARRREDAGREHRVAVVDEDLDRAAVDEDTQMRKSLRQRARTLLALREQTLWLADGGSDYVKNRAAFEKDFRNAMDLLK